MGTRHLYWILTGPFFAVFMRVKINGNQTFILDAHRPFLCSVYASTNKWEPDIYIWILTGPSFAEFYASKTFLKIL
jgi:hypothetical protein